MTVINASFLPAATSHLHQHWSLEKRSPHWRWLTSLDCYALPLTGNRCICINTGIHRPPSNLSGLATLSSFNKQCTTSARQLLHSPPPTPLHSHWLSCNLSTWLDSLSLPLFPRETRPLHLWQGDCNQRLPWLSGEPESASEPPAVCFTSLAMVPVKMAPILVHFSLLIVLSAASSCDMTAKWTEAYRNAVMSALNISSVDLELKKCVDQYPILDTDNDAYQKADGTSDEPCCHMLSLEECLLSTMLRYNVSEQSAKTHSVIFTQLWSGNDFSRCDSLLTRHCATCLIYLNKTVIISIATITSLTVLGIPLTLLLIKYGWRWYCFGERPHVPSAVQSLINNVSEASWKKKRCSIYLTRQAVDCLTCNPFLCGYSVILINKDRSTFPLPPLQDMCRHWVVAAGWVTRSHWRTFILIAPFPHNSSRWRRAYARHEMHSDCRELKSQIFMDSPYLSIN